MSDTATTSAAARLAAPLVPGPALTRRGGATRGRRPGAGTRRRHAWSPTATSCRFRHRPARRTAVVEVVVPVYDEEVGLRGMASAASTTTERFLLALAGSRSGGQRQPRPHVCGRSPAASSTSSRACRPSTRRQGTGPGAAGGRTASPAPRRRLHGRRPPTDPDVVAPRRPPRLRAQRRRDRHPPRAASRIVRGPEGEAIRAATNPLLRPPSTTPA